MRMAGQLLEQMGEENAWRDLLFHPARDKASIETLPDFGVPEGNTLELLAGGPSFDLSYPKIPGRDLEGVPNANDPVMREKLRQRLLKNPNATQELPGFLKRASIDDPWLNWGV